MPRRKNLVTVIQDIVRREIADALQSLLSFASPKKKRPRKAKDGSRKRRRPGRPRKDES